MLRYRQPVHKIGEIMKHVLLVGINAKYIHSNLAIRCLKAACDRQGVPSRIDLCEYTINPVSYTHLVTPLAEK